MSKIGKELKLWAKDDIVPADLQVLCKKASKSHDDLLAACKEIQRVRDACRSGKMNVRDVDKAALDKQIDDAVAKAEKS